jgi:formylglycine-generating enzyme
MSRSAAVIAWLLPCLLASACGAPFIGVAPTEGDAGEPSSDVQTGGALSGGGRPAIVVKPTLGGGGAETDAPAPSEAGAETSGGSGGEPGELPRQCPSLSGAKLVLADGFCIDESEVTAAQYRAFVDQKPSVAAQPAVCLGNTTFANNCKVTTPEKEPQRCVDWCDARAYCESVGKRLCGATAGGAAPFDAAAASNDNQWYAACSRVGKLSYPYGDEYDPAACWGADRPTMGALAVKSAEACVGGYDGLWDMSGNLAEWVDSCGGETGMTDACHIRGGSLSAAAEQLRCDGETATPRNTSSNYIGFRCCAELVP